MSDTQLTVKPASPPANKPDIAPARAQELERTITEAVLKGELDVDQASQLVRLNLDIQETAFRHRSEETDKRERRKFVWALQAMAAALLVAAPLVRFEVGTGFLLVAAMICAGTLLNARERDDDEVALIRLVSKFIPWLPSTKPARGSHDKPEEENDRE